MYRVGICDDNSEMLKKIEGTSKMLLEKLKIAFSVKLFISGREVIEYLKKGNEINLLLLDIIMPETNGFRTAELINKRFKDVDIVFVTGEAGLVYEGYKYKAFRYVLKEHMEKDLSEAFKSHIKELYSENTLMLTCKEGKRNIFVKINDIVYFEFNCGTLTAHLSKGSFEIYGRLGDFEKQLKEYFFEKVHRSYLINLDCIIVIEGNHVKMSDGSKIPLGIRSSTVNSFKDTYIRYLNRRSL